MTKTLIMAVKTGLLMAAITIFSTSSFARGLEVRVQAGIANGHVSTIHGLHAAVTGTTGSLYSTSQHSVDLLDNKISNSAIYGLDANYFWNDHWGINAGISKVRFTTHVTNLNFDNGAYISTPGSFPSFTIDGYMASIGPVYRWKDVSSSKFSPYLGVNFTDLFGNQNNTNDPNYSGVGTYGVGGPKTHVNCMGYTPRAGISYDLNKKSTLSVEYKWSSLECHNGAMRSMQWGYKTRTTISAFVLSYGWMFN